MLRELKYIKVAEDMNCITYRYEDEFLELDFWKSEKEVSKSFFKDSSSMSMDELKAINKKCKEMGWL